MSVASGFLVDWLLEVKISVGKQKKTKLTNFIEAKVNIDELLRCSISYIGLSFTIYISHVKFLVNY